MEEIRINKYLTEYGFCSRRAADRYINEGRVLIDGIPAELGQKVSDGMVVTVDGKEVRATRSRVFLMVNKPPGIVCTAEKKEKNNIVDFINYKTRVYPVGRLDKDSRGLILMTNEGEYANEMLRARNYHEKEYLVTVDHTIDKQFISAMKKGVYLSELELTTRPCKIKKISDKQFSIILTQGLNRQIRRMCKELSYNVTDLKRVRFLTLTLGDLPEGSYRELSESEINELMSALKRE
ncbi:MAG: pseudouridine synthase [Lachnospiraceae bacterium]|nr:pseudouridine synthase [Lachnospiraceae bacterium]